MSQVVFDGQTVHEIKSARARALFLPSGGARLLTFVVDGTEVVVWPAGSDFANIAKVRGGNPVLFPVTARHFVDGQAGLARFPGHEGVFELPVHGFARTSRFEVAHHDATSIRMLLRADDSTKKVFPFDFAFMVSYQLTGPELTDLSVELRTLNTSKSVPMPYYPGHHFYFAIPHTERAHWQLHVPCEAWGFQDKEGQIHEREVKANPNAISDEAMIDNFSLRLNGTVVSLHNTATNATIELDLASPVPWYNVTSWAMSPEHDHYCVEPWLGLPNAVHHGLGLRTLQPGQEEAAVCTIRYKATPVETPASVVADVLAAFARPDRELRALL